jgi:tRNA(His) guanylyltransferase
MANLGDRMKLYEGVSDARLPPRIPIIIRVDGRAFHTLTKGMDRPWDDRLVKSMNAMAAAMCRELAGCKFAYVQSDEASFLLTDWDRFQTQGWFNYRVQKIASMAAAIATDEFGRAYRDLFGGSKFEERRPRFDARVATYPRHEVVNYFVWRQQDATRNSIQMLAQSKFSHKECHGQNTNQLQEMLHSKFGINWNDTPTHLKRGSAIYKTEEPDYEANFGVDGQTPYKVEGQAPKTVSRWGVDLEPPIFTKDREFIGRYLTDVFWKEDSEDS